MLACSLGTGFAADEKQQLNTVRSQLKNLQQEVKTAESKREHANRSLQTSERAINDLKRKLHELEQQQNNTRQQLDQLNRQHSRLERTLGQQQTALANLLQMAQQHPAPEPLTLLIQPQDPNQLNREMVWLGQLGKARADLMISIRSNQQELKQTATAISNEEQALQQIRQTRLSEKEQLENQQQAKKQALAQLNEQIQTKQQQITRLKQDESRLASVLLKLQQESRKRAQEAARQAALAKKGNQPGKPVVTPRITGRLGAPTKGELLYRYGSTRPDTGTTWKGIFLRTPANQGIQAVAAGRVVFADWLRGFGNLLIIDHGNGLMSLYGNNDSLLRRVGEAVDKGDKVALAGNSGGGINQTGLYFEMRQQGQTVDPLRWISL